MSLRVAALDLNGQWRGKRLGDGARDKVLAGETRMPLSTLNLDLRGSDIAESPLVFESGDRDGTLVPVGREVPMPWLREATLIPCAMHGEAGPFEGDPLRALARALEPYAARGWTVRAACEVEFYLTQPRLLAPPEGAEGPLLGDGIVSLDHLDDFAALFDDLYEGAEAMGIPLGAAISEGGPGQFEIDIQHQEAAKAAMDAELLKLLIYGTAQAHGLGATFLAKPYEGRSGSGMHVHMSVMNGAGNVLARDAGLLEAAVAGCLAHMPGHTLIFAPFATSYMRLEPGAHAPIAAHWGHDNRTVAVRIPAAPDAARRVEHRVAGADANALLVMAAVAAAAMDGIERGLVPPPAVTGNAYEAETEALPGSLAEAVERFDGGLFAGRLAENLTMTKRQEMGLVDGLDDAALRELHRAL